jgi:hypothetical protein
MAMVDMKRSKEERADADEAMNKPMEQEPYPYGLHVELDHDSLKKLGVDQLPKVGSKLKIHAHGHVVSAEEREHEHDGGKKHRHVRVQLRQMEVEHSKGHEEKAAGAKGAMDDALSDMGSENDNDAGEED